MVLPTSDEEAFILSKNRNLIENKKTKLACTDFETIKVFNDKISTYEKLKFNMPKPDYVIVQKSSQLDTEIKKCLKNTKRLLLSHLILVEAEMFL